MPNNLHHHRTLFQLLLRAGSRFSVETYGYTASAEGILQKNSPTPRTPYPISLSLGRLERAVFVSRSEIRLTRGHLADTLQCGSGICPLVFLGFLSSGAQRSEGHHA